MHVLEVIVERAEGDVGRAFDGLGPPAADVVKGGKGSLWCLIGEAGGETVTYHGCLRFMGCVEKRRRVQFGIGTERACCVGRDDMVIFGFQSAPAIPDRLRCLAVQPGGQSVEMHVPAGAEHQDRGAVRQPAMDDREKHVLASRLQFKGDGAATVPGDGEPVGRIELGNPALHAMDLSPPGRLPG